MLRMKSRHVEGAWIPQWWGATCHPGLFSPRHLLNEKETGLSYLSHLSSLLQATKCHSNHTLSYLHFPTSWKYVEIHFQVFLCSLALGVALSHPKVHLETSVQERVSPGVPLSPNTS